MRQLLKPRLSPDASTPFTSDLSFRVLLDVLNTGSDDSIMQ
jgi:hypothetical protein